MAKVANPYGLRPLRRVDGLPYAGQTRQMKIASGYNTTILTGDLVAIGTDGTIQKVTGTTTAPAGTVGVFMGVQLFTGGPTAVAYPFSPTWVAGTVESDARAYVIDDPGVAFLIQANDSVTQDMLGSNFGIEHPSPGDHPFSRIALDVGSANTTTTLPLRLIDFLDGPMSKVGDEYTDVIVKLNQGIHTYTNSTGVGS